MSEAERHMIELSEVIRELRTQLAAAVEAGAGHPIAFELGDIELEVSLALQKTLDGTGKLRFWVLEFGVDGSRQSTDTQRVKLTLRPRSRTTGRSPIISGSPAPGEE